MKNPSRVKVAVVDDNIDAADTLKDLLQFWGFIVQDAHDGPSALKLIKEFRPDVVLLDIGLPIKNGYEVARELRSDPDFEKTILVAITGYGLPSDKDQARSAGFNYHFTKPANADAIRDLIQYINDLNR